MGFNNGYDAGWQDAINAVKYGKVPGLGPASEIGDKTTPATRAPKVFTLATYAEGDIIGPCENIGSGVTTDKSLTATAVVDVENATAQVSMTGPDGGFVTGDIVAYDSALSAYVEGVSLTLDGADIYNLSMNDGSTFLIYTGSTFKRLTGISYT